MPNEEDDFLQPTTFKEKLKEKTPDVFYFGLMILAFGFVVFGNKNNQTEDMNTITQSVKRTQEVKQTNAVLFNDSINQHIR